MVWYRTFLLAGRRLESASRVGSDSPHIITPGETLSLYCSTFTLYWWHQQTVLITPASSVRRLCARLLSRCEQNRPVEACKTGRAIKTGIRLWPCRCGLMAAGILLAPTMRPERRSEAWDLGSEKNASCKTAGPQGCLTE